MWQKTYASGNWQEALKHCEDLDYAGYRDWRLPNKNELLSLWNEDKSSFPYSDFPDMPNGSFWSSTPDAHWYNNGYENAWYVRFDGGPLLSEIKTATKGILCVRSE